jgi:hypothetical protein
MSANTRFYDLHKYRANHYSPVIDKATAFQVYTISKLSDWGFSTKYTYETQGCALSTCCPSGNFYSEGFAWLTSSYSHGIYPQEYKTCALRSYYAGFGAASGESISLCCLDTNRKPPKIEQESVSERPRL